MAGCWRELLCVLILLLCASTFSNGWQSDGVTSTEKRSYVARCTPADLYTPLIVRFNLDDRPSRKASNVDLEVLQVSVSVIGKDGPGKRLLDRQTLNDDTAGDSREFTICMAQDGEYELSLHSFIPAGLRSDGDSAYSGATICGARELALDALLEVTDGVRQTCRNWQPALQSPHASLASPLYVESNTYGQSRRLDGATPTVMPTAAPSRAPTKKPKPSQSPTSFPTSIPTSIPTSLPTSAPTPPPTSIPTSIPTSYPTPEPTSIPTSTPTYGCDPTPQPSAQPSSQPTSQPSTPTSQPTSQPSAPTSQPSSRPSSPTKAPTRRPTPHPTSSPGPTKGPTRSPTTKPSACPFTAPSARPTVAPSRQPTRVPSATPTLDPSAEPSAAPTEPTAAPTEAPTDPTAVPSPIPSMLPSTAPTQRPTRNSTLSSGGNDDATTASDTSATPFLGSTEGVGIVAGAAAAGLMTVAGAAYYLLRASQNLVRVPPAPAHMANSV